MDNQKALASALTELGLTSNAVRLYLLSFEIGRTTVGNLAHVCGMDRSSAHLAADQLRAAGLLEELADGGKKMVWVKAPKEVLLRLRIRIRNLRSHYDAVEDAIPAMDALYREKGSVPLMQVFSGKDGLRQVVANILANATAEILLITNQTAERQVFTTQDHQAFIAERMRRSLHIRVLASDTPEGRSLVTSDGRSLRHTKILSDSSSVMFHSETYIYGDCVAMLSFRTGIMGFVARSKDFADMQRWIFERLWRETF